MVYQLLSIGQPPSLLPYFCSAALLIRPCITFFSADDPSVRPMITAFLSFVFTAAFALALLGFVVMHLKLVATNQTTIEAYEKASIT